MSEHGDRPRPVTVTTWVRRVVDESGETVEQPTHLPQAEAATVATIMTRTPYCVKPDVPIETVIALLLERHMSGMPVVDDAGHALGVVTKTDLLRHLHESGESIEDEDLASRRVDDTMGSGYHATAPHGTAVRDIMMPVVFTIDQDSTIALAAALMAGEGIHRLPVLAKDGTVVGILSSIDVVRWVAAGAGYAV